MSQDQINTDEIVVRLDNNAGTAYSMRDDAEDLGGIGPAVSLSAMSSDRIKLAIDRLPFPTKSPRVIGLYVDAIASGTYQLELTQLSNLSQEYRVILRDHYLRDSLIMHPGTAYSFTIDKTDSATYAGSRFDLVISVSPDKELKLLAFNTHKEQNSALINWKVKDEYNTTTFYVERSTDLGLTFQPIGSLQSNDAGSYDLPDENPISGENQYRLKLVDVNDNITYSNVATLFYAPVSRTSVNVRVFPNPTHSSISLSVMTDENAGDLTTGAYEIKIVNSFGLVVKKGLSQEPNWHANVSDLSPGTYIVQVTGSINKTLIGTASFVKD